MPQVELHPSPSCVFPSSHSSPASRFPLPQPAVHVGDPVEVQSAVQQGSLVRNSQEPMQSSSVRQAVAPAPWQFPLPSLSGSKQGPLPQASPSRLGSPQPMSTTPSPRT